MNDNLTIQQAIANLRRYWWAPFFAAAIGFAGALAYLATAQPIYSATAIIGPRQNFLPIQRGANLGVGGLLSSLQGGPDNADLARADIFWQSQRLADSISKSDELVRQLFPGRWNYDQKRWERPQTIFTKLLATLGIKRPDRPTTGEIHGAIAKSLSADVKLQSFRTLQFTGPSPEASARMLSSIISITNDSFRTDDMNEVNSLIAFSYNRIGHEKTQRESENLANLVEDLERQRIQMEASRSHLFEMIQAPTAEAIPISPKPQLVIAAGTLLPPTLVIGAMLLWPAIMRKGKQHEAELV